MSTLRDLVHALGRRPGVTGVVVLGRDGLLVDAAGVPRDMADHLAALAPGLVQAAEMLGDAAGCGGTQAAVLEFERGLAVATTLTAGVVLLVLLDPSADAPALIHEVRRSRAAVAALV